MPVERPAYRPDLEGLRGIAILLVVLFHAGVYWLAGGFVGVDVFFVLSGFFITGLLLRELANTGGVNLTAFWGRRALRLLPAFLVVLVATLAAVMLVYAPIDRAPIAANARAVALYSGNIDFARGAVDYFSSGENPLLHTWSLAVEEQFYLVWPLLFLAVAVLYSQRIAKGDMDAEDVARRRLLVAIGITGVASLAVSLWLTGVSQSWAFFGMPTRIWEFALGGVLAVGMRDADVVESSAARLGLVLQVLGVAAIAIAVLTYDRATPYPGVAALLPALGTVGLLVGGQRAPASFVSRWLSVPWLQLLGRLSYAWYLWHWPLVGLGAVLDWHLGVWGKLAWSAVALVLAWLTYLFVELPAREGGGLARIPTHWLAPAALGASLAVALVAHLAMVTSERRVARPDQRAFAAARFDRMDHPCWGTTIEEWKGVGACAFGDKSASTTLVLLGDSHAEHWLGALDRLGKERRWKIVAMVKGGCPVADMPEVLTGRRNAWYAECARYREAMVRRIIAMRPAAAILSSWDHYMPLNGERSDWQVTPKMWSNGLRRTYSRLSAAGIKTIAMRGTPRTWFDVPACLSRRAAGLLFAKKCEYDRSAALSPVAAAAQNAAARGLNVTIVSMNDQICATPRCSVVRNGIVVFTDDNHLTRSFSASVAPVLGTRLSSILSSREH